MRLTLGGGFGGSGFRDSARLSSGSSLGRGLGLWLLFFLFLDLFFLLFLGLLLLYEEVAEDASTLAGLRSALCLWLRRSFGCLRLVLGFWFLGLFFSSRLLDGSNWGCGRLGCGGGLARIGGQQAV